MRVDLHAVAKGPSGIALPATSLSYSSGRATLAIAETAQRPSVLGLIASGRMAPDAGEVALDGAAGRRASAALRRRVALVDAPDVSEPSPGTMVAGVVAEELMFAQLPSDPISARRWLHARELNGLSRLPIADLDPAVRIRILLELAAARPGVDGLVLVSPDRHGGAPTTWWRLADSCARRGAAVLVIAGAAAASVVTSADADAAASAALLRPSRVRPRGARHGALHDRSHRGGAASTGGAR